MNDNLPPLPPCAPEFQPRWPNDPEGYTADQMHAYAIAAIAAAPQPQPAQPEICPLCNGSGIGSSGVHSLCVCQYVGAAPQPQPVRCTYCDGTGDVHSITGEWRGSCGCEAGKAQPQPVQEPVKGWWAHTCPEDGKVDVVNYQLTPADKRAGWVEHEVYTSPQAQPLSNEQITKLPVWRHFVGLMPDHHVEITRAIEQAHGITKGKT